MDTKNEKYTNSNLYFVAKADMKSKTTLEPRIPQNFLTDNEFEDNKIKRVCFSTSIDGAVTALSQNLKNTDLFVYSPIGIEKRDIYTPSISQVPDRSITGEVWIRKPVQIECIGKIHVTDAKKNPQRYKYGNNIAELYEWNWKWVDKNVNESVSAVYGAYDAHGKWNAAVDVDGRTYRYRVECLIINGDKVFVSLDKHGNLIIPGGSVEKDIDDITQVANECREEARINIKKPIYTGINRIQGCPPHISKHKSVLPFEYDGSLSKVYVAEYDSYYDGYIDEYDKDEKMIRGKFVPIKDAINRLKPEWREALNKYTSVYYRVTYNGEGIYNALKNNIPSNVWIGLLKSDAMRWLPKPPKYNESGRSYFTKEGFKMFMRKTYPVMRKYLNPEFVNIEEVRLPNKMMYSDKYQVVTESSETKYDPPYTYDEIVKNYGKDVADKLVADPAHKFRCHTGIELIHKEPSLSELNRIHSNWQLMTDEQKRKSDTKSRELFGCDNETNYTRLVKTYNEACKDVKTARKFVSEVGKLAKKYDANYFIVTDGASGIHNNGNPAVKNARDSQVGWETKHGFDPDEDWSKTNVNESVFMNKDDYYFDFDKFESGESNILFVTGLTGSGKSTIGRSFASKYHAEYVELDLMDPCSNLCSQSLDEIKKDKSNKVIYEYLSSHKSVYERLKSGKMRNDEIFLNNVRFISFVRSYANKHKDTKFIVEGLQLYEYCTFRKTIIKPMVIKGTSVLTSFIRKVKREKWSTKDIIKYAPGTVKRMIKDDKVLLQLINACKTDDVINESVSSVTSKSAKGPDDALAKDIRAVIKSLSSDDYKSFDYKSKKMYYQSVYYDGDNPIGFVFTRSFDEEGRHSLTISVALNPDYRGKGLALKMVKDVLNTIKQDKSIYQIYWGADMDNKGSIELAKRAGFKHNYDYRDSTFYTRVVNDTKTVNESVKRSELPDDVFGIPQERKYPMQDKQHVKAAIKFFNYVEPKYEEQLANRIIENMEIYNIDPSSVGDKNRLKKYIKESTMEGSYSNMRESLADELAFIYFESENDPNVPDLIEPVVKQLESKGYQVKYASPGHINTRFNNDRNKDGVINAKMTSTARIIFSRDYHFKSTPQGWEWKVLNNNSKALYVKPYTYNEKMGSNEEAFKKWQTFYISNIKTWAAELPKVGSDKDTAPDTNF